MNDKYYKVLWGAMIYALETTDEIGNTKDIARLMKQCESNLKAKLKIKEIANECGVDFDMKTGSFTLR